jgi:hypothetical protein
LAAEASQSPKSISIRSYARNGFFHWPVPVKKTVVHRTDSFGDRSIKTADL